MTYLPPELAKLRPPGEAFLLELLAVVVRFDGAGESDDDIRRIPWLIVAIRIVESNVGMPSNLRVLDMWASCGKWTGGERGARRDALTPTRPPGAA